jgi:hypothetical protein
MPLTWTQRKVRLDCLLDNQEDDDAGALVMDRLLHGQSVIGKTCEPRLLQVNCRVIDATPSKNQ